MGAVRDPAAGGRMPIPAATYACVSGLLANGVRPTPTAVPVTIAPSGRVDPVEIGSAD